jgi:hypothetical protein
MDMSETIVRASLLGRAISLVPLSRTKGQTP